MVNNIIAKEENSSKFEEIDQKIDIVLGTIESIKELSLEISPENSKQTEALSKMQKIIEEALEPYMGELIEAFEVFEEED